MEFLKQNASGLYLEIQKIGCFFRSACHLAEMKAGKALTVDQLNKLWEFSKSFKYINQENNIVVSAPIANLAGEVLGLKGHFIEVATFKDGMLVWYGSVPVSQRRIDYYIQKIEQPGPSKTHFTVVDKYGDLVWDPHDPDITKLKVYYTICYKYEEK